VAREYGITCVVNVQGIIAALEDGDFIEVDGTSGIVKRTWTYSIVPKF